MSKLLSGTFGARVDRMHDGRGTSQDTALTLETTQVYLSEGSRQEHPWLCPKTRRKGNFNSN